MLILDFECLAILALFESLPNLFGHFRMLQAAQKPLHRLALPAVLAELRQPLAHHRKLFLHRQRFGFTNDVCRAHRSNIPSRHELRKQLFRLQPRSRSTEQQDEIGHRSYLSGGLKFSSE